MSLVWISKAVFRALKRRPFRSWYFTIVFVILLITVAVLTQFHVVCCRIHLSSYVAVSRPCCLSEFNPSGLLSFFSFICLALTPKHKGVVI